MHKCQVTITRDHATKGHQQRAAAQTTEKKMNDAPIRYNVIDSHAKRIIKSYPAGKRELATRFADRKDMGYGACRYSVRPVWAD